MLLDASLYSFPSSRSGESSHFSELGCPDTVNCLLLIRANLFELTFFSSLCRVSRLFCNFTELSKGIHDVSFNRPASRGSFGQSPLPTSDVIHQLNSSLEQSLNQSWIFYNYTVTASAPTGVPASETSSFASNPNKAILTIDARSTEVSRCF